MFHSLVFCLGHVSNYSFVFWRVNFTSTILWSLVFAYFTRLDKFTLRLCCAAVLEKATTTSCPQSLCCVPKVANIATREIMEAVYNCSLIYL